MDSHDFYDLCRFVEALGYEGVRMAQALDISEDRFYELRAKLLAAAGNPEIDYVFDVYSWICFCNRKERHNGTTEGK